MCVRAWLVCSYCRPVAIMRTLCELLHPLQPQVEHYRSLYEESQCSTVAAQAEVRAGRLSAHGPAPSTVPNLLHFASILVSTGHLHAVRNV
jgi:hypothetical protein